MIDHEYEFRRGYHYAIFEERDRFVQILKDHKLTNISVAGFLMLCTCGEGVDDYTEHMINLVKDHKWQE